MDRKLLLKLAQEANLTVNSPHVERRIFVELLIPMKPRDKYRNQKRYLLRKQLDRLLDQPDRRGGKRKGAGAPIGNKNHRKLA